MSGVAEPLMPLGRDLDIAIMGGGRVLHNPTHAVFVRRKGVAELPERIALEVKANEKSFAPGQL